MLGFVQMKLLCLMKELETQIIFNPLSFIYIPRPDHRPSFETPSSSLHHLCLPRHSNLPHQSFCLRPKGILDPSAQPALFGSEPLSPYLVVINPERGTTDIITGLNGDDAFFHGPISFHHFRQGIQCSQIRTEEDHGIPQREFRSIVHFFLVQSRFGLRVVPQSIVPSQSSFGCIVGKRAKGAVIVCCCLFLRRRSSSSPVDASKLDQVGRASPSPTERSWDRPSGAIRIRTTRFRRETRIFPLGRPPQSLRTSA